MDKRCTRCKLAKAQAEFNRNRSKPDGFSTECRACVKLANASFYAANREREVEKRRADYAANSDEYKRRAKAWRESHPERVGELKAAYRERDREKIKEHSRKDWEKHAPARRAKKAEWRKANPAKCNEHVRKRQTSQARQMPPWADREAILAVYTEARRLTKETGIKHHVDHEIPLRGKLVSGLHVQGNLRPIPALDNHRKGNRSSL